MGQTPDQNERISSPTAIDSADRLSMLADHLVLWVSRHWLALFNLALALYLFLPFLAPLLMRAGLTGPARAIYFVYTPMCHQLPDRSYFLFGEQRVYALEELEQAGVLEGSGILERRRYIGDAQLGWKAALCQRDVAIYGAMLAGGLAFGLLRRRGPWPKLSFKVYLLFLLPVALDGLSQLVGLRTSTWWLRTITGAIFGLGTVWLAYPFIEEAMNDIRRSTEMRATAKLDT